VAKGSEQISSRWLEGAKRECRKCGKKIVNMDRDVGEVRTRFPGEIREILCTDCLMKREKDAKPIPVEG
jgi:hypothetical protein